MIMPGDNAAMDVELITPIAMEEKQRQDRECLQG
jgi:translation elongation factor EF-Tu-like GTPase